MSVMTRVVIVYSLRQLFANAAIAASRVAVRRRAVLVVPKASVHIHGEPRLARRWP
jgi:hypothetical protein